jgi:tetratricopeptide (TPR) repeat protein
MQTTYPTLDELLNGCTVRIQTKGGHGTGFCVAPGLVLTCAHVIKDAYQKNTPITLYFGQNALAVKQIGGEDISLDSYPDLALLKVDLQDHPCVLLGTGYRVFIDFYSYGYTQDHPEGESTTVECEGKVMDGGTLIKLKEGQVKPGSSGSPLLNTKTGFVCGVINRTRGRGSDLGGTGIPMATVFAKFPDLEHLNRDYHRQDSRWKDLTEKEATVKTSSVVAALLYSEPGKISKPVHWVGREELSRRVNQLLERSERVLLTGMGGIGKTSLAQMLVEERLQMGSKFILWLEVGNERSDPLIEALAKTCGDEKIPTIANMEAKKLALKELLAARDAGLLVLDNVRNLVALDDLLEAVPDNLLVLMTSRMSFAADDIVEVDQLTPAEALDLLEKASGAADFSNDDSARILCNLFGYHPLALEILGASMKERRGLSPTAFLKRLEANPIRLSSLRRGEMRPLLDDYVADLSDAWRSVFFTFGKFPVNRLTPAFLAVYLDTSKDDVTEALDKLVERNLVKRMHEDEVYYLHDLIFHYVQTISGKEDQDKNRLIQTGIAYLEANPHDYDLVSFDLSNLLGIAGIAQGLDLVKLISYLTIGDFPLQEGKSYADQRGYSIGVIEQLDRAIDVARSLGDELKPTTHFLLGKRGNAAFQRGEYALAAEKYEKQLLISPDDERKVIAGSILGRTLAHCGRLNESRIYFKVANDIADELNDDVLRGFVLEQESWTAGYLKDFEYERQVANKQLAIAESHYQKRPNTDTLEGLFYALLNLGVAELELAKLGKGEFKAASEIHERALKLAEENQSELLIAYALTNLGEEYHYLGNGDQAIAVLRRAHQSWFSLNMNSNQRYLEELVRELGYPSLDIEEEQNE